VQKINKKQEIKKERKISIFYNYNGNALIALFPVSFLTSLLMKLFFSGMNGALRFLLFSKKTPIFSFLIFSLLISFLLLFFFP
jgi:hypothetical protein